MRDRCFERSPPGRSVVMRQRRITSGFRYFGCGVKGFGFRASGLGFRANDGSLAFLSQKGHLFSCFSLWV